MRIHRIYCKSVSGKDSTFDLDQSQSRHLSKVLRLKIDDKVEVFDGHGAVAICKILVINRSDIVLERIGDLKVSNPVHPKIISILQVIKKDNLHFMAQKLTEVGVSEFIFYKPQLIDQSIAKKDLDKTLIKINEVVVNACKQCGSNVVPNINFFEELDQAITLMQDSRCGIYAFDIDGKNIFDLNEIDVQNDITIITGPESGFSKKEIKSLRDKGIQIRLLKNNILRAETAPIVISSLLQNHFGKI